MGSTTLVACSEAVDSKLDNQRYEIRNEDFPAVKVECKAALGTAGKLLGIEEKNIVYCVFEERIPFLLWGIDWEQFDSFQKVNEMEEILQQCECKDFI